ncbi:hypothetical protein [Moritella sp. F3]|uniref:hypothetical protein n=1 Tax=Moritella sp. F3 TaxID=2718882 RepID=UPI0018E15737|nr:hypothetical protein [Moritella sp. F3]GIC77107.1 hypothetical protein FMO001_18340 [Moritella sp. F1]GIC82226.1 hypothetical protein FMO003_25070 [Moritella sp. F3]
MNITIGPKGRLRLEVVQQRWRGEDLHIIQTSMFARQEMMIIQKSDEEPSLYDLHYLGFVLGDIEGVNLAKEKAPDFAKTVLNQMTKLIMEFKNYAN